jgi:hypothetical protein
MVAMWVAEAVRCLDIVGSNQHTIQVIKSCSTQPERLSSVADDRES